SSRNSGVGEDLGRHGFVRGAIRRAGGPLRRHRGRGLRRLRADRRDLRTAARLRRRGAAGSEHRHLAGRATTPCRSAGAVIRSSRPRRSPMFRRTAAALLVSSLLAVSAPASATSWPMFQNDRRHTGRTTAIGPSTSSVRKLWEYKAVSWIKNEPSIGPDGTIYIGDSKFPLCALTPSGARIWCTDVGGFVNQSSPAVGNPFSKTDAGGTRTVQTIYIGDRNNVFWAIDSEGDVLWHYRIHLDGDVRQSPLIGPGPAHTVYMMCGCTTKGVLHAFRPDGTLLWSVDLPQVRDASPAGIQVGSHFRLYVVTNNGQLYAIDDL